MKSPGFGGSQGDHPAQLRLEFLAQALRYRGVTLERFGEILRDGGMVLDSHRWLSARTRLQNSGSVSGWTLPLSISRSRRSTSANSSSSEHAWLEGDSESSNDSASNARCATGKASSPFSISSIDGMLAGYDLRLSLASYQRHAWGQG